MGSTENDAVHDQSEEIVLGLNRSERVYLAFEGVGGSLNQVYALRFQTRHGADEVKRAFREVVRAHPRLRSVVQRTFLGHRLRLRNDGPTIDVLVDHAFQVWEHRDTSDEAVAAHFGVLINEPFAIERDLPIRARFLPHPERPMLILTLHHVAGDGRTYVGVIEDLLRALDGQPLTPVPVDPPGYDRALRPRSLGAFFRALWTLAIGALRTTRDPRTPLRLPRRWLDGFAPGAAMPMRLRCSGRQLAAAARARGTTINTLVFAALAVAMRRAVPDTERGPVRGRLSIDLRGLFPEGTSPVDGNYVSSFFVDVDPRADFDDLLRDINAQTKAGIQRFHERTMFLAGWVNEVSSWLGRKLFGRLALAMKNGDRLPAQSFHFSNLGRMDGLNAFGPKLDAFFTGLPHNDLFLGMIGFGGNLYITASYPRGEIQKERVHSFLADLDTLLADMVAEDAASEVPRSGERAVAAA